jgi:predicted metal-binding protein
VTNDSIDAASSLSVLVCRGCCCGTVKKHPGFDHNRQLEQLRAALPAATGSKLWEVDCLGPCSSSNVIVVRSGHTRRWFGNMLDERDTHSLATWIQSGGQSPLPAQLAPHEFEPDVKEKAVQGL